LRIGRSPYLTKRDVKFEGLTEQRSPGGSGRRRSGQHVLHTGSELVLGAGKTCHVLWDCQRSDACNVVLNVDFRSSG
jgi:hypothetical protein